MMSIRSACWTTTAAVVFATLLNGCAGSPAAPPATASAQASQGVLVGPSAGKSSDPALAAWQTSLLEAIGRENQYVLFNYVGVGGALYVGIDYARLDLSKDEATAANEILSKHSSAARTSISRENNWLMPVIAKSEEQTALLVTQ